MLELKNGRYIIFEKEPIRLSYCHISKPCWKAFTTDSKYIQYGFIRDGSYFIKTLEIDAKHLLLAYEIDTYCNYRGGLYYLENIWNGLAILSPEFETKKQLGLHAYDDRRIEINYNEFINEVEEIWEERTPIEGFKFDAEPIFYIKGKRENVK